MRRYVGLFALLSALLFLSAGWAFFKKAPAGMNMTEAAQSYLATLGKAETSVSVMDYDSPKRVGWHFIPKSERKGLQFKNMSKSQRQAAIALLRTSLSKVGATKARNIMALEGVLKELEGNREGGNIRDTERYYFTVFGKPTHKNRWGLSIEGHHLSLNFVIENDKVISSSPTFFAANPATVMNDVKGPIKKGTRVLAEEEQLAFDLVNSLGKAQTQTAIVAAKAPREIRAAGEPQPPQSEPEGLAFARMEDSQKKTLMSLIRVYANNLPTDVSQARLAAIEAAGADKIHFAWAGATKPGIGHYYRIQGPTFLIEFVNTQPDPAGNPANHIHCVWRDPSGDFALPIK